MLKLFSNNIKYVNIILGIPAAMSLPHFLHADSSIYDNVKGLNPDSEKHTSQIIIQPVNRILIINKAI